MNIVAIVVYNSSSSIGTLFRDQPGRMYTQDTGMREFLVLLKWNI